MESLHQLLKKQEGKEPRLALFEAMSEVPEDPLSVEVQETVRKWDNTCLIQHEQCGRDLCKDMPLPTRILELGAFAGNADLCLKEANRQNGLYVALSDCWGPGKAFTTTSRTL